MLVTCCLLRQQAIEKMVLLAVGCLVARTANATLSINRSDDNILSVSRADDRTRTDNLLFTRQLLCRLSYAGAPEPLTVYAYARRARRGIIAY